MRPKNKIVSPSTSTRQRQQTDFARLWQIAKVTFKAAGMDRQYAVLENFKDQKEEICRVLNIVGEADLARIRRQIEQVELKGK